MGSDDRQARSGSRRSSGGVRRFRIRHRVAFVMPTLKRGGAETQAIELARRLPALGWLPVFFVLSEEGELIETARNLGFRVHLIPTKAHLPKWSPGFWLDVAAVIARLAFGLRRERVAVMQSFLFWSSQYAVPAAVLARTRAIVTCRLQMGIFKDKRSHYQRIENLTNKLTDAVIANALAVRRDVLDREVVDPTRVVCIYNGLDLARFAEAEPIALEALDARLAGASPLVLCVGNLKRVKRHDVFLRGLELARRRVPTMKGILVGADHGEREGLELLARNLGIADHVFFAGAQKDPAPIFRAADIFAITSDGEGLPNVVLEAMAAGLPVVATRVGGIPELVSDEDSGLLFERGDPYGLADALVRLATDPVERDRMAMRARAKARSRLFAPETLASAHVALWENLLRTGRPPRGDRGGPILTG